jgi:hypothetical protein
MAGRIPAGTLDLLDAAIATTKTQATGIECVAVIACRFGGYRCNVCKTTRDFYKDDF